MINLWDYLFATEYSYLIRDILIGGLSAALVCIGVDIWKSIRTKTPLEMETVVQMNQKRRKRYVKARIAQSICDGVEELYFKKKITREERDQWYQTIGSRCDLVDLLPSGPKIEYPDQDDLKKEIRGRLQMNVLEEFRKKWYQA